MYDITTFMILINICRIYKLCIEQINTYVIQNYIGRIYMYICEYLWGCVCMWVYRRIYTHIYIKRERDKEFS